ncbi:hypothetical protein DVH24_039934 [Malus domestica]|uniref:O-methyltransferase C-terminal domain-containing protein n=1 Tax=Malus domestica TaxID=3750 RepID=A0A498IA17_MALDO|nr:hypothetical protein DVH24_039934 [Malus domestica]
MVQSSAQNGTTKKFQNRDEIENPFHLSCLYKISQKYKPAIQTNNQNSKRRKKQLKMSALMENMMLKAAIELGLQSIHNPDAPSILDRMLCLLSAYSVLTCSTIHANGKVIRVYGLAPISKYYIKNPDGSTLVDVGGGDGTILNMIISKHPAIKGINSDFPSVVKKSPSHLCTVHIARDMFVRIPKGDAIFMKALPDNYKIDSGGYGDQKALETSQSAKSLFLFDVVMG